MAVALAMDAFAIAITLGVNGLAHKVSDRFKISIVFGCCQGLLFIIGMLSLKFMSGSVTTYNHLIAGVILIVLGVRMLKEALEDSSEECFESKQISFYKGKVLSLNLLVMFGLVTSIDALAAGITYGLIYEQFILATSVVTIIAFLLSYLGSAFGKRLGHIIGSKATIFGGIAIILLGFHAILF